MNKDKTVKIIGTIVMLAGFGINIVQKQLDDKKLEKLVEKEVQKQLDKEE